MERDKDFFISSRQDLIPVACICFTNILSRMGQYVGKNIRKENFKCRRYEIIFNRMLPQ